MFCNVKICIVEGFRFRGGWGGVRTSFFYESLHLGTGMLAYGEFLDSTRKCKKTALLKLKKFNSTE